MDHLSTWEMIALGAIAIGVIFWFRPGIRAALRQSRENQNKDWAGALIPIGLVVLFVILLISLV